MKAPIDPGVKSITDVSNFDDFDGDSGILGDLAGDAHAHAAPAHTGLADDNDKGDLAFLNYTFNRFTIQRNSTR